MAINFRFLPMECHFNVCIYLSCLISFNGSTKLSHAIYFLLPHEYHENKIHENKSLAKLIRFTVILKKSCKFGEIEENTHKKHMQTTTAYSGRILSFSLETFVRHYKLYVY